jgi:hypothetical protein
MRFLLVLALLAAAVFFFVTQLPDIQRYLKMRSM